MTIRPSSKLRDEIVDRAVAGIAERMGCDIERRWQANGKRGSAMTYIGLVMRGRRAQKSPAAAAGTATTGHLLYTASVVRRERCGPTR